MPFQNPIKQQAAHSLAGGSKDSSKLDGTRESARLH